MVGMRAPLPRRRADGFTLIEMLAVVLLMALVLSIFVPNLGVLRASALRDQARRVAADIEFARQRAVMTGKPHRVLLDLEEGGYRVEWYVSETDPLGEEEDEPAKLDLSGRAPLDLSPPVDEELAYQPIPEHLGRQRWLEEGFFFEGIQTPEGWLTRGEAQIVFESDGTTDDSELVIVDDDENAIRLEVRPLLDTVRIVEET
jgi:prepilin-type N-terminal cleavage/methylation domain-containing protein